jgi:hypothetical protein
VALLVVGAMVTAGSFTLEVTPFSETSIHMIDALGDPFYYGGPILIALGIVVTVARWRLPHIVSRPRGTRSSSVAVLTVALLVLGTVVATCLLSVVDIAEAITVCETQEC